MSIQASPLPSISDIVFLFTDNDTKTFVIGTDIEFQHAINRYFNVSITNALFKGNKGEFEEWHLFNLPIDFLLTFRLGYTF
jgi:hypothetical protein